jgi:hypothetical protein
VTSSSMVTVRLCGVKNDYDFESTLTSGHHGEGFDSDAAESPNDIVKPEEASAIYMQRQQLDMRRKI